MTPDAEHPNYCRIYARKTPTIPYHNGRIRCLGCGKRIIGNATVRAYLRQKARA